MRWLLCLCICVLLVGAVWAADYTITPSEHIETILTERAADMQLSKQTLLRQACENGIQSLSNRYLEERAQYYKESLFLLPDTERRAIETVIEEKRQEHRNDQEGQGQIQNR